MGPASFALVGRGVGEFDDLVDDRKMRLFARTVPFFVFLLGLFFVDAKNALSLFLELLENRQLKLLRFRHTLEPRHRHPQTNVFIHEAMVFAIDEKSDLAEGFEIVFVSYANHGIRLAHRDDLTARENCVISGGDNNIFPTNRLPSALVHNSESQAHS